MYEVAAQNAARIWRRNMNRMKIDKIITSIIEQEIQLEGLILLSKEEYEESKNASV